MPLSAARSPAAFVFDAYGTLFDVHSIARLAEVVAPTRGDALSQLWRTKQLEYTWLQSLMIAPGQPRDDFAVLTARALDYAFAALGLSPEPGATRQLLDTYRSLAPFPDAVGTLAGLAPRPRLILSNGTLAMLDPLVNESGLSRHLDGVLSVDAAGIYKPSPRVYQLAVDRLRLTAAEIGFVSSNGWDAAGAKAFGFTTYWVNRSRLPVERHARAPDFIVGSLAEFASLVS